MGFFNINLKFTEHVPEVMASEDKSTTEAAATMLELGQQNSDQTVTTTDHTNAIGKVIF